MKLFRSFLKPDPEKIRKAVKSGYRVERPEKILGYEGAFLAGPKDVYLTDRVARCAEKYEWFRSFLEDCILRFMRDDYGFITELEAWNNGETRYLCGSTDWMIARYPAPAPQQSFSGVVYANLYDIALISFIEENVSGIYEKQYRKSPYENPCGSAGVVISEIRYEKHVS